MKVLLERAEKALEDREARVKMLERMIVALGGTIDPNTQEISINQIKQAIREKEN